MKRQTSSGSQLNKANDSFRKRFVRKWCILSASLIVLWSAWTLLDAFVIPRDFVKAEVESTDEGDPAVPANGSEADTASSETASAAEEEERLRELLTNPVITDTSYNNGLVNIEIRYVRTLNTDVYVADVTVSDPSLLGTALAEGSFGRNVTDTTSSIAQENGAILAINGDYYGFRDSGYVVRSGYLYRSTPARDPDQEDLVLYEDGSAEILKEADTSAEVLWENGAREIFSFGPGLVIDGEISVDSDDEVERAQVTNPRTAFGVLSPLHYVFVVSDGRTKENVGLSLLELAQFMKELGCNTAYNLDGGGSSTMWFNGEVLNHPTTFGDAIAERKISDIVYISK